MGKYKSTIENGYSKYLQEYPDYRGFGTPGDCPYPLQSSVLSNSGGRIIKTQVGLEEDCIIELREDIPGVSELPMDDLAWLPVGLTDILKIQRTEDHDAVWTVTGKVLLNLTDGEEPFPNQIARNIETLIRAVLYSSWSTSSKGSDDSWDNATNRSHILAETSIMARYMAFPTVEGMVKSLFRRDIEMDGTVRPGRQIRNYAGSDYCGDDPNNNKVSDLGHLLWHLEQDVVNEPLQSRMEEFREAVCDFFQLDQVPKTGAYGYLSNQRNSALHGQMRARAEFGVLLNLISLIILNIDHIPEERRRTP